MLVTVACATSALALLVLGIVWTLAERVAFRGDTARVGGAARRLTPRGARTQRRACA